MRDVNEFAAKKNGAAAANVWMKQAPLQDVIDLAASQFGYGETLNSLIDDGHNVPQSADPNFSWGFFKKVKGHVHHRLWKKVMA